MRVAVLLCLLVLAGCSHASAPPKAGTCVPQLSSTNELPPLDLPCADGSGSVHLRQFKGPMVVNLWASWCEPCAKELPALQRLADRNTVAVVGVATDDTQEDALSRAEGLGVHMLTLFDGSGELRRALGQAALPLTLFVDAEGKVTRYSGPALTDEKLDALVHERFGVLS